MAAETLSAPPSGPGAAVIPFPRYFDRGDHTELAEKVLERLGPDPLTHDAGELWRYRPVAGIWEMVPGPRVRTLASSFAGSPIGRPRKKRGTDDEPGVLMVNASTAAGAEKIAKDTLLSDPDRVTFDAPPLGVAFRNGFVRVRRGKVELVEHSPEHRARHAFPFDFDPEARTPMLDAFFDELFRDGGKLERDLRVALLQEFVGACLIGEVTRYQRCLVLYATGGNGKSELLRILRGLFPPEAVTSLVPQWWSAQFRAVMLEGKLANFCDELPDAEIMGGEAWKLVVTGEPIPGERKGRDAFIFRPIAGHIFATNSPIRTTDHSDGFWRRPLPLGLTRKFEGDAARVLEAGQKVLDAEHPGIAAWALYGAARAQQQGGYTVPPSSIALAHEWRDENDQVRGFIGEQPVTEKIQASELYGNYVTWAKANGLGPMSATMFGRRLMAAELCEREGTAKRFYVPRGTRKLAEAEAAAQAALEAEQARKGGG